ncbi:MAG TPA: endo-1,4-beta-xylanase [Polyangiaceae bacterium]|nr:endo-1,4-beta-xylanase [Polyangiaceae bacterium]
MLPRRASKGSCSLVLAYLAAACSKPPATAGSFTPESAAPTSATPVAAEAASPSAAAPAAAANSLARKYAPFFPIGAAVNSETLHTHADLLAQQFDSITAENEMKFESLEKTEGKFDYASADEMVAFASAHGMKVRGHNLVWHRQTPDWVFKDASGGDASKELLLARLKNHISSVVGHFKGKLYAWDVVNEAIMDDGKDRTESEAEPDQRSKWHAILGTSYIAAAFRFAHEADPAAKLFYNDYRNYIPAKRDAIYQMLKQLLAEGVPIHGVGLQCHLAIAPSQDPGNHAYYQTVENLEKAIELYASLGLDVQITELDMSVYAPGGKYTPDQFYKATTLPPALLEEQAARYGAFFELFRKHKDQITGVTFWGIADDRTWLSTFKSGRQDFPLLFDVNHLPKPAFQRVMDF